MGSATKIIVRPDGGITRRREPVTLELSALGRTAVRLRATAALNVHGDGGTVQRRNGCSVEYTGADPLAEVLWISFWQAWRNGGGVFPWGPLTLITEHDDVTVDTVDLDGGDWADGRMPERRSQWDPTASGQSAWAPGRWGRRSKRSTSLRFRIEDPAEGALGVVVTAPIVMQWTQHPKALKYRWQVTDADTGAELAWNYAPKTPVQPTATSTVAASIPADTLPTSRACKLKVWAILAQDKNGVPLTDQQADNVRTFYTKLSAPTNLAPVGSISTLTPTFTCDPVPKAVRYKVKVYDAAGTALLHTSTALLLPSYVLSGGVLSSGTNYKWTYTAYADTACTAAYGTESAQVAITQALENNYYSRLILSEEDDYTKFPPVPVEMVWTTGTGWLVDGGPGNYSGWRGSWSNLTTTNPVFSASVAVQITSDGDGTFTLRLQRTVAGNTNHWSATYDIGTNPLAWSKALAGSMLTASLYSP